MNFKERYYALSGGIVASQNRTDALTTRRLRIVAAAILSGETFSMYWDEGLPMFFLGGIEIDDGIVEYLEEEATGYTQQDAEGKQDLVLSDAMRLRLQAFLDNTENEEKDS